MPQRSGILLLVSGPSGSGQTTLCRRLADEGEACYSTSCTTRPARPGEVHGHDYFFLSTEDFQQKVSEGEFLEHATVHGNFYGTLRQEVIAQLAQGRDVVMDIDVQGAAQVRACADPHIRLALVDLFVMPPSEDELHARRDKSTCLQTVPRYPNYASSPIRVPPIPNHERHVHWHRHLPL